jgi:hypothetical protein
MLHNIKTSNLESNSPISPLMAAWNNLDRKDIDRKYPQPTDMKVRSKTHDVLRSPKPMEDSANLCGQSPDDDISTTSHFATRPRALSNNAIPGQTVYRTASPVQESAPTESSSVSTLSTAEHGNNSSMETSPELPSSKIESKKPFTFLELARGFTPLSPITTPKSPWRTDDEGVAMSPSTSKRALPSSYDNNSNKNGSDQHKRAYRYIMMYNELRQMDSGLKDWLIDTQANRVIPNTPYATNVGNNQLAPPPSSSSTPTSTANEISREECQKVVKNRQHPRLMNLHQDVNSIDERRSYTIMNDNTSISSFSTITTDAMSPITPTSGLQLEGGHGYYATGEARSTTTTTATVTSSHNTTASSAGMDQGAKPMAKRERPQRICGLSDASHNREFSVTSSTTACSAPTAEVTDNQDASVNTEVSSTVALFLADLDSNPFFS